MGVFWFSTGINRIQIGKAKKINGNIIPMFAPVKAVA